MASYVKAPPTARLDPWMSVADGDAVVLFGYCEWHARLGGRSWMRSSALLDIDPSRGGARTVSGGIYSLGRRIGVGELPDDEARTAFALLIGPASRENAPEDRAPRDWLAAAKVARWVGVEPPGRDDVAGTRDFIDVHLPRYVALRQSDLLDRQGAG